MHEPSVIEWLVEALGLPQGWAGPYKHVVMSALVALLITAGALIAYRRLKNIPKQLIPDGFVTITNIFEIISEAVLRLMEDIMGPKAKRHLPLIGSLFVYLLVSDLIGVIPGFSSPTENINTNLGCALVVFIYYNYVGIREQGFRRYFKHMAGPVIWLAPLLFTVEIVSHIVRPISLSVRLMGNIAGDHLVVGIFSDIAPLIIPIVFIALAIFISIMQAFVFTLLSIVYIHMAQASEV